MAPPRTQGAHAHEGPEWQPRTHTRSHAHAHTYTGGGGTATPQRAVRPRQIGAQRCCVESLGSELPPLGMIRPRNENIFIN